MYGFFIHLFDWFINDKLLSVFTFLNVVSVSLTGCDTIDQNMNMEAHCSAVFNVVLHSTIAPGVKKYFIIDNILPVASNSQGLEASVSN